MTASSVPVADPPSLRRALTLLFSAHAVGLLVPLLTVPWLARALGPTNWAPVLMAQALAGWAILVLEFGFDLAGTRNVAQAASAEALARTAATVVRARLWLTPVVTVGVIAIALWLLHNAALAVGTVLYVIARGLSPYWFFQGKQQLRGVTAVETLGKVLPALLVFAVVQGPRDAWLVLALQAAGAWFATIWMQWRMHRQHLLPAVTPAEVRAALREAAPMFGARAASGVYLQANVLILSALAPLPAVAAYGGAERIVRAAINLLIPFNQAVFPRISQLRRTDPARALRETKYLLGGLVLVAIAGISIASWLAPQVIVLLLGAGYAAAVPVFRLLALTVPLVTAGTVLGIYWALPWRREQLFLGAILAGGVVNVALAATLVPHWGARGMATAVVGAEACVTTLLATAFVRFGMSRR